MDIKITSYFHGKDMENISFINLIFLLDCKTVCTIQFKDNSCLITVYENDMHDKKEISDLVSSNILFEIFDTYLNLQLNQFDECEIKVSDFLPKVIQFIKNHNIDYEFMELGQSSYDKKMVKGFEKRILHRRKG